jgi:AraC-like DNA-binding protein
MMLADSSPIIAYSSMSSFSPDPRLARLLSELATGEGFSASRLPGVRFMRSTHKVPRSPIAYQPSIVIVGQGKKHGHLGTQSFTYDPTNYLVLSVPLPFECETEGTPEEPMLGLSVGVTPATVAELLMQMENLPPISNPRSIHSSPLDPGLSDAAVRLVEALRTADDARILAPQIVREIIYRVLRTEQSGTLRALGAPHTHFGQISRALNRIHSEYAEALDMTTLATEAGMSVSTFHSHFKSVTASSPLQYLKNIRLHKARMMMVHEGTTAAVAAREVGYESASQFSREFKRYFGDGPASEASRLRESLMRF